MKPSRACSSCGAVLPADAPESFCADCRALASAKTVSAQLTATEILAEPIIAPAPHAERMGHYKLLQKIGEGGCGVV